MAVGVGRGADLLSYLGLMGLSFLLVRLYIAHRALEAKLVDVVRALAIAQAHVPRPSSPGRADPDVGIPS